MAYFTRFKNGESEQLPAQEPKCLPIKKNYKMSTHMHSLDWYGADSQPGTINAIMRYMGWDICSLSVKDITPYRGKLNTAKYSDDKVLFLDGQEYHPFNWKDKYEHLSHNGYHMLAIGVDPEAYTPKYTCSFFSDEEIKDIDEDFIVSVITKEDIMKMAAQLDHSMGSYMQYFQVLCILLSAVMIYLLTKLIIEKNETAISMTKILGYDNREIASLYLVSTSIVVVISDIISVVLGAKVMDIVWRIMLQTFSGWFSFHMTPVGYVKMFVFVLIGYLIVTVFDFRRIKRIPMDMALKNVE